MSIRTILLALGGGSASLGAADTACRIANRFDAHLEGLHVRQDPRMVGIDYGAGVGAGLGVGAPVTAEFFEGLEAAENEVSEVSRRAFDRALASYQIGLLNVPTGGKPSRASADWREEISVPSEFLPRRARLFDLVVVGRSERVEDQPSSSLIETLLVDGGRPVLVAPAQAPASIGETIAIAWNGSSEAARALAAAIPFLEKATKVVILTAEPTEAQEGLAVAQQLAWHGISADPRHVGAPEEMAMGEFLLSSARDEGADLLVMGGYGRAPWREMLFGGATRDILSTSHLPILLAH